MADHPTGLTSVSRSTDIKIDNSSTKMQSCSTSSDCVFSENQQGSNQNPISGSCSLKRKRPPKIEIPNVLREIVVDRELGECAPLKDAVCSCGYGVGVFSLKGKKKFMEDAHKIVSCSFDKKVSSV